MHTHRFAKEFPLSNQLSQLHTVRELGLVFKRSSMMMELIRGSMLSLCVCIKPLKIAFLFHSTPSLSATLLLLNIHIVSFLILFMMKLLKRSIERDWLIPFPCIRSHQQSCYIKENYGDLCVRQKQRERERARARARRLNGKEKVRVVKSE